MRSGQDLATFLRSLRDATDMPMHHAADIDQWLTEASDSPEHVPMPSGHKVMGTVRETDETVARVAFEDVVGDVRVIDLSPTTALALAGDLIEFVRQVGLP